MAQEPKQKKRKHEHIASVETETKEQETEIAPFYTTPMSELHASLAYAEIQLKCKGGILRTSKTQLAAYCSVFKHIGKYPPWEIEVDFPFDIVNKCMFYLYRELKPSKFPRKDEDRFHMLQFSIAYDI
eukprot:GDKI01018692.1.p1 GENE.GDKI01018692.1~~GDKI01018692.1.p1  ORF type:complete len:128 (-),score=8.26 GDKI01018692.1:188-571(-)